ncbi:ABC transporter ATP-binding protein [[Clostridium] fimetarium]|uniref:ATP-binding cassette, subfamily B n=1 Tax=[Clostridium] fimetarium TaxID=99656 RepID=A0A1I0QZY2_9FIRM|nr:ABC transporter ATP-binding protein [[Clostridium] fimetarium]SEW33245.1 ATP-binding cassette, subfamily B [[Clostridium] fimetarium]
MKNKNKVFFRYLRLLGKRLPLFLCGMLLTTVGSSSFEVVLSMFIKDIFNLAETGEASRLPQIIITNILIGLVCLVIFFVFGLTYNIEAKRGNASVQKLVFDKALRLPMSYYENHHSGDIVSKLIYDVDIASQIYTSRLRRVTAPIISVIIFLVPMFLLCPQVTACLLGVNIITLGINSRFVKPMKRIGKEMSVKNSSMTERLSTILQGMETAKIFDGSDKMAGDYKRANAEYTDVVTEYNMNSSWLSALNTFFDLVCSLAFLCVGILFIENGTTSVGSLAAIYTLYGLFSMSFLRVGHYFPELINCIARAQIIFDFLDEDEESLISAESVSKSKDLSESKGQSDSKDLNGFESDNGFKGNLERESVEEQSYIEINNVSFGYSKDRRILEDFTMNVKKGTNVAVTGQSGRGKSTLAKLLLGFYPIEAGEILIGGEEISSIGLKKLREMIAYVPQTPYLFNVSIRDNIRFGKLDATEEEIKMAAKAANADEFIMKQPDGYDTITGERGGRLSGGERQRIAVARAILKNAPILLLDEATSALDNESEQLVQAALDNLLKNRTTITIAHKPATIAAADVEIKMM